MRRRLAGKEGEVMVEELLGGGGPPRPPRRKMDNQAGPYIYHGTDSETLLAIQAEGMHTKESMEMSTDREPIKRLWFARNATLANGFAGRRIEYYSERLRQRAMRAAGIDKEQMDFTPEDEEKYMEIARRLSAERRHIKEVIVRIHMDNIPEDCDVDEPEGETSYLGPEGRVTEMTRPYVILDNCEVPPSVIELCRITEITERPTDDPDDR